MVEKFNLGKLGRLAFVEDFDLEPSAAEVRAGIDPADTISDISRFSKLHIHQWDEAELIGPRDVGNDCVGDSKVKGIGGCAAGARGAALKKEYKRHDEKRWDDEPEDELRCILNVARYAAAGHVLQILRGSQASSTQKRMLGAVILYGAMAR